MACIHFLLVLVLTVNIISCDQTLTVNPSLINNDVVNGVYKSIPEAIAARNSSGTLSLRLANGVNVFTSTLTVDGSAAPSITRLELIATNSLQATITCQSSGYNPLLLRKINQIYIRGVQFQGCNGITNTRGGGALLVYVQSSLEIESCIFSNNIGRKGGALALAVDSVTVPLRTATITNTQFLQNTASISSGGAVFIEAINTSFVNCQLNNNVAAGEGGAVQMYREDTTPLRYGMSFTNCIISGNKAIGGGGALDLNTILTEAYFELLNCVIANNFVDGTTGAGFSQGGAIYAKNPSPLLVTNCNFAGNTAKKGAVSNAFGGAIYARYFPSPATPGSIVITNSLFAQNVANSGAGLMVSNSNSTLITNCQFASNQGVTSNGALLSVGSNVTLVGVTIVNNLGTTAIRAESNSIVYLNNSKIINNANANGVSCDSSTLFFYQTSVYNNKAGADFACGATCQWNGVPNPCGQVCAHRDPCSICNGTNTCVGCDGILWSPIHNDACGVCGGNNSTCAGCDGVPNSGAVVDACGVCGGNGLTCAGCDGVPNSGAVVDACGVCGGNNSTCAYPTCPSGTVLSSNECVQPESVSQCSLDIPTGSATINPPFLVNTPLIGTSFTLTLAHKFVSSRVVTSIILGNVPECNYPGPYWTKQVTTDCNDTYVSSIPWNTVQSCGLTKTETSAYIELSGRATLNYSENITLVNSNLVFQRTSSSSFQFNMVFPSQVFISITNTVYGDGIGFAVVGQVYDVNTGTLEVDIVTAVISPFKLTAITPLALEQDLTSTQSLTEDCANSGDCLQFWKVIIIPLNQRCNFTGNYSFGFNRSCNDPEICPQTSSMEVATFFLTTGSVCGSYTEVANYTISLNSFENFSAVTNTFSSPSTAFYINDIVYFSLLVSRQGPPITSSTLKKVTATNANGNIVTLYENGVPAYPSFSTTFLGAVNGIHKHEFEFTFSPWFGTVSPNGNLDSTISAVVELSSSIGKREETYHFNSRQAKSNLKIIGKPVDKLSAASSQSYSIALFALSLALLHQLL